MTELNKWTAINCTISMSMFFFISYKRAGVSGGDMAIHVFNILFGILQIITIMVLISKKQRTFNSVVLFIVLLQIVEFFILTTWGHQLNNYLR